MKKVLLMLALSCTVIFSCACSDKTADISPTTQEATVADTSSETEQLTQSTTEQAAAASAANTPDTELNDQTSSQSDEQSAAKEEQPQEDRNMALQMKIGSTPVTVEWEDNDAVAALKDLCKNKPLTINTSMYGGFEQVGAIGAYLPQNDVQTTTSSGDIVLYSGNQLVVFYGSNAWAYTRLGKISDKTKDELTALLGNDNVTITIEYSRS